MMYDDVLECLGLFESTGLFASSGFFALFGWLGLFGSSGLFGCLFARSCWGLVQRLIVFLIWLNI